MKKSLFILTAFLSLLLSCVQTEEQQERESAIRDATLKETADEKAMKRSVIKEAMQDSLKVKNSQLLYFQSSITEEKINLESAKEQLRIIQESGSGKSSVDKETQIKDQSFKIASIEEQIGNHTEQMKQIEEKIEQLKAEIQKQN